uniref:Uncharacterized protein n=1 Tax=Caenorhabditis japonica TaxID=281687 RepID=A0A8R1DXQ5_CAEJA
MPSATKSTSSLRKIQVSRPRPYPSSGVRVELCANGRSYAIRPRKEATAIPGAGLVANSEALLGSHGLENADFYMMRVRDAEKS